MRRLLFILPFVLPRAAFAQSQAANPVTPFSEGQRVGTSLNPIFAALSSVVPSAAASSGQAAAPVELYSYGRRVGTPGNPIYINLGNALAAYLTQTQAASTYLPLSGGTLTGIIQGTTAAFSGGVYAQTQAATVNDTSLTTAAWVNRALASYLPLTGGNTTGALNGVNTFQGLIGSSASGASTVLTTDGSGAVSGTNCLQVPTQGVTKAVINVIGASTNGTDAVMQVYPGIALFTASSGTPALQGSSASFYPVFGSPSPWSVVPTVDTATKCVVITTKGSGTGSWKWRASIQYENLVP